MSGPDHLNLKGLLLAAVASFFLLLPAGAMAAGGGTKPSKAPLVEVGKHYFGNTSYTNDETRDHFWRVPSLLVQDVVTIAWNSSQRYLYMCIAVDIDDFNWAQAEFDCNGSDSETVEGNGSRRSELEVDRTSSSAYLTFHDDTCCNGGTSYDFVVEAIQHKIGVNLTKVLRIRPKQILRGGAVLSDGSNVPNGLTFTLKATWKNARDTDQSIEVEASSEDGQLAFPVTFPRSAQGRTVSMEVSRAADSKYLAAESPALEVKVAKPRAPAAFLRCRRQTFRKLFRSIRMAKHGYRGGARHRKIKRAYRRKGRQMKYCRAKYTKQGQRQARRRAARRRAQQGS